MDSTSDDGDRRGLAWLLAAAGLAVVAIASFRKGKRLTGTVAALGAAGVAYGATTKSGTTIDVTGRESTSDEADHEAATGEADHEAAGGGQSVRVCAVCGDPIRTGQARRPDENDDVAHETCLEATN